MKTWHFFLAFAVLSFDLLVYSGVYITLTQERMEAHERTILLQCIEDDWCDYAKTQGQLELHREPAPWQAHALVPSMLSTVIGMLGAILKRSQEM